MLFLEYKAEICENWHNIHYQVRGCYKVILFCCLLKPAALALASMEFENMQEERTQCIEEFLEFQKQNCSKFIQLMFSMLIPRSNYNAVKVLLKLERN